MGSDIIPVRLPDRPELRNGRVVEILVPQGTGVEAGQDVLVMQIQEKTLLFQAPRAGMLDMVVPIASQPKPGELLFTLAAPEPEAVSPSTSNPVDVGATVGPQPGADSAIGSARHLGGLMRGTWGLIRGTGVVLEAMGWILAGVIGAAVLQYQTGISPIGGWIPEERITMLDGIGQRITDAHIQWRSEMQRSSVDRAKERNRVRHDSAG